MYESDIGPNSTKRNFSSEGCYKKIISFLTLFFTIEIALSPLYNKNKLKYFFIIFIGVFFIFMLFTYIYINYKVFVYAKSKHKHETGD